MAESAAKQISSLKILEFDSMSDAGSLGVHQVSCAKSLNKNNHLEQHVTSTGTPTLYVSMRDQIFDATFLLLPISIIRMMCAAHGHAGS